MACACKNKGNNTVSKTVTRSKAAPSPRVSKLSLTRRVVRRQIK